MMSKRFQKTRIVDKWGGIYDSETDRVLDVNDVEHKLNEQQENIKQLQDLCGKSDYENAKLRIENKKLKEEKGYWESKAMTLLMQVRRLTSRMTDAEVKEFNKELENE